MNPRASIEVLVERDPLAPVEQSDGERKQDWVRTERGGGGGGGVRLHASLSWLGKRAL